MLSVQRCGPNPPNRLVFRLSCPAVTSHRTVLGRGTRHSQAFILEGRTAEKSFPAYSDISQAFQLGSLVTNGDFESSLKSMTFL